MLAHRAAVGGLYPSGGGGVDRGCRSRWREAYFHQGLTPALYESGLLRPQNDIAVGARARRHFSRHSCHLISAWLWISRLGTSR